MRLLLGHRSPMHRLEGDVSQQTEKTCGKNAWFQGITSSTPPLKLWKGHVKATMLKRWKKHVVSAHHSSTHSLKPWKGHIKVI
jgi:hypothetical protein